MRCDGFTPEAPGRLVTTLEGHLAFVPDSLPPRLDLRMSTIRLLADAERALGELKGVGQRLPNPHLLIHPFQRREAVLSSRIEGTTTSVEQLVLFEAARTTRPEPPDVQEVANYVAALELGFTLLSELPVCLRLILKVHERLLQDVRGQKQRPGEFRALQNRIGLPGQTMDETRFVPPPVREMTEAMYALETYIGKGDDALPFLVQLALIHYQFEVIHPFMDGNGRVGRLLIALLLHDRRYLPQPLLYMSAYFERHDDEYRHHLLRVSQAGAWNEWIGFFLRGVAQQALDTAQRSYRLLDLWEHYRSSAQTSSSSIHLLRLIDLLFHRPAMTMTEAQRSLAVTHRTAAQLFGKLERQGILAEVTGRHRNRIYLATDIVGIIAAPEATSDAREAEANAGT